MEVRQGRIGRPGRFEKAQHANRKRIDIEKTEAIALIDANQMMMRA